MDYALIGDFYSPKLLITEYDVQPTNEKQIVDTAKRKVLVKAKQSLSISLSGVLIADDFKDLEKELAKLHAALNKGEIKLVFGSRPECYYLVSWNGSSFPRKARNGGYSLPISLEFTGLESTAVKALPSAYGWMNTVIPITHEGNYATGTVTLPQVSSLFTQVYTATITTATIFTAGIYTVTLNRTGAKPVITLSTNSGNLIQKTVYDSLYPIIGLVLENNNIALYYDGNRYESNYPAVPQSYSFKPLPTGNKTWEVGFGSVMPHEYIMSTVYSNIPIIRFDSLSNGSNTVVNSGTARAGASVIVNGGNNSVYGNEFGFTAANCKNFIFNGDTGNIDVPIADRPGITYYPKAKTYLPYLEPGRNILTMQGTGTAVIAWQERYL